MNSKRIRILFGLIAVCLVALISIHAQEKTKIKGLITARTGETIIVKTMDGTSVTVILDDGTKVQDKIGIGLRKKQYTHVVLIPGLKISVEGTAKDATHVLAKAITFDGDDLETAQMIEAGLDPTKQNVAANTAAIETNKENIETNKQAIGANQQAIASNKVTIDANAAETSKRFSELSEYDTKGQVDVHFASGSTKISASDQEALKKFAHEAVNQTGYIIQVKGFADASGDAAMNTKLSHERASNVIAFLVQTCNVPVRHVVAPGAMGETNAVASNETKAGRAENRRVEVKVLVNKGISGN